MTEHIIEDFKNNATVNFVERLNSTEKKLSQFITKAHPSPEFDVRNFVTKVLQLNSQEYYNTFRNVIYVISHPMNNIADMEEFLHFVDNYILDDSECIIDIDPVYKKLEIKIENPLKTLLPLPPNYEGKIASQFDILEMIEINQRLQKEAHMRFKESLSK